MRHFKNPDELDLEEVNVTPVFDLVSQTVTISNLARALWECSRRFDGERRQLYSAHPEHWQIAMPGPLDLEMRATLERSLSVLIIILIFDSRHKCSAFFLTLTCFPFPFNLFVVSLKSLFI